MVWLANLVHIKPKKRIMKRSLSNLQKFYLYRNALERMRWDVAKNKINKNGKRKITMTNFPFGL